MPTKSAPQNKPFQSLSIYCIILYHICEDNKCWLSLGGPCHDYNATATATTTTTTATTTTRSRSSTRREKSDNDYVITEEPMRGSSCKQANTQCQSNNDGDEFCWPGYTVTSIHTVRFCRILYTWLIHIFFFLLFFKARLALYFIKLLKLEIFIVQTPSYACLPY